uniref:Uncharacterized protein n=1 Tax=Anopheles atroparvus TaxID=41427 RepID=A0A182IIZ9_ANOAO
MQDSGKSSSTNVRRKPDNGTTGGSGQGTSGGSGAVPDSSGRFRFRFVFWHSRTKSRNKSKTSSSWYR